MGSQLLQEDVTGDGAKGLAKVRVDAPQLCPPPLDGSFVTDRDRVCQTSPVGRRSTPSTPGKTEPTAQAPPSRTRGEVTRGGALLAGAGSALPPPVFPEALGRAQRVKITRGEKSAEVPQGRCSPGHGCLLRGRFCSGVVPWKGCSGEEEPSSRRELAHLRLTVTQALLTLLLLTSVPGSAGAAAAAAAAAPSAR